MDALELVNLPSSPSSPSITESPCGADTVARLAALERVLGRAPTEDDPDGAGVAGCAARLERVLGRSPDDATGEPGTGLCRTVAELRRAQQLALDHHGRRMAGALGLGAGTGAVAVQLALELLSLVR